MKEQGGYSTKHMLFALSTSMFIGFYVAQFISNMLISESIPSHNIQEEKRNNNFSLRTCTNPDSVPDHPFDNSIVADQLRKEVRILCWIMTNPNNHKNKSRHIKRTWGKRCNILLFMSSEYDDELPTVKLDVGEGRVNLWRKVKEAFKYVYKHHYNDADWFYKADDDTYAIMENLRYMLYPYHPMTPVHFGCKFKAYVKQGFMAGGPGYVLSKEALRRLVVEGIPNNKLCRSETNEFEDVEIGSCLEKLNVIAGDSRDWNGRGRMFPFIPEQHLLPIKNMSYWYWSAIFYQTDEGLDCCSDNTISFHYIDPKMMYAFEYLIYQLRPYGIVRELHRLPAKLNVGEFLPPPIEEVADSNEDSVDDDDRLMKTSTSRSAVIELNSSEVNLRKLGN